MMKTPSVTLLVIFMLIVSCTTAQVIDKTRIPFDFDWRFALNDHLGAERPKFNDSKWRLLDVPHDFSIEHPSILPTLPVQGEVIPIVVLAGTGSTSKQNRIFPAKRLGFCSMVFIAKAKYGSTDII